MTDTPPIPPQPEGSVPPPPPASPYGQLPPSAYAPQAGYAQPGYAPGYVPPRTNTLSIVALVLSLVGVSIGGVICGHIALSQIRKTGEQGRGLALAGAIIGWVGVAGWVLFWVLMIAIWLGAFAIWGLTTSEMYS